MKSTRGSRVLMVGAAWRILLIPQPAATLNRSSVIPSRGHCRRAAEARYAKQRESVTVCDEVWRRSLSHAEIEQSISRPVLRSRPEKTHTILLRDVTLTSARKFSFELICSSSSEAQIRYTTSHCNTPCCRKRLGLTTVCRRQ